ncbi:IS3 family transposase, partial [Finegoldia magna]
MILKLLKENPQSKVSEWLKIAKLPKSSYYEWKIKLENPVDKDKEVKDEIKTIIEVSKGRYGYRRVTMVLKNKGFN